MQPIILHPSIIINMGQRVVGDLIIIMVTWGWQI
jgi:hypothetical protein